jgi:tetratricopeptide (TPR) repeat protein
MIKRSGRWSALIPVVISLILSASCVSHLKEAKYFYTRAQTLDREMKTEQALAAFKRAHSEAFEAVRKNPSSQAYLIKGLAEIGLESWSEAEDSFRAAFVLGFEKGEEWAEALALWGAASTLEELGLEDSAFRIYKTLTGETKLRQVTVLAAEKYTALSLERARQMDTEERTKALKRLLSDLERMSNRDLGCGYFHYALSQICGFLEDYRRGFEEAVLARELGLEGQKLSRDNDLQIIFCADKLSLTLEGVEKEQFDGLLQKWTAKWGWPDRETPDWKLPRRSVSKSEKQKEKK